MTATNADMTSAQLWVPLSEVNALALPEGFYTIGSENLQLSSIHMTHPGRAPSASNRPNGRVCVRGVGGSTAATHSSGATLTRYYPDAPAGGGGSISATGNAGGSVANVTEMQFPGTVKQVSAGVALAGGTVVVSADDPGAIGHGNLWLQVVFGNGSGDGGYGRLWVRNSADSGWNSGGPMAFGDATSQFLASPNDVAELALNDSGGSSFSDANGVQINAGGIGLLVASDGIHVGVAGSPVLLTGSADPSAGGGVVAVVGSVYLRTDGTIWRKSGAGATAWTNVFGPASLATYLAAGNIGLVAASNTDIDLSTSGTGELHLNITSGVVRVSNLPTADPAVADQLWNNGGVLTVSAG